MHNHHRVRIGSVAVLVAIVWVSTIAASTRRHTTLNHSLVARTAAGATTFTALPRPRSADAIPRVLQPMVLEAIRDSIVSLALAQLGMPYVLGGTTPRRGFDCSGLVRWVTAQVHMAVPRTARMQARTGEPVPRDALKPGDLLAFGDAKRISHVGIYVGHGKFVHASSVAGRVVVSALDRKPSRLIRPMRGARRLLASADGLHGM